MPGVCCEANLVVAYDVYCAVRGVIRQVRQVESLVHDALAGERSVPVKEDRQHLNKRQVTISMT